MTAENIFPICFLHILLLLLSVWKVFMSVRPFISNHVLEKHGMLTDVLYIYVIRLLVGKHIVMSSVVAGVGVPGLYQGGIVPGTGLFSLSENIYHNP